MKILFTGKTDFEYNRVKVLLTGLAQLNDVEIVIYPIKKRKDFNVAEFKEIQADVDFVYIPPFKTFNKKRICSGFK